ncbi:MAG: helix-turn-helix transcriptional regulator [Spirochaetales bacterium]|nr:helix-turn-helix transcriptional regulator [Spirochaetales bacterium]
MDWIKKMNNAVSYIEDNLENNLDLSKIAETANCSISHFQRLFSFIAGIPLSEYIRNRRLSIAAEKLKSSDVKVIDVALQFCYESPEAFCRAFRNFHGISPSKARKPEVSAKYYPYLSFQTEIRNGRIIMGTKSVIKIEELTKTRVVSFKGFGKDPEGMAHSKFREWALKNTSDYLYRRIIGFAPAGHHPDGKDEHEYILQMFLYDNEEQNGYFHDIVVEDGPYGLYLISNVPIENDNQNTDEVDIGTSLRKTSQIMYESLQEIGSYELDDFDGNSFNGRNFIEEHICSFDWFNGTSDNMEFKLWLPIKRKNDA